MISDHTPGNMARVPHACTHCCRLEKTEVYKEPSPGAKKGGGGGASAAVAASSVAPPPAVVRGSIGRPRSGWVSSVSQSEHTRMLQVTLLTVSSRLRMCRRLTNVIIAKH